MPDTETFRLHADSTAARDAAVRSFDELQELLGKMLPAGTEIHHVGATAIAGCLTKGDLDILVRIPTALFEAADRVLAGLFQRNSGSIKTSDFSAFEDGTRSPALGVQLTAIGGTYDVFHRFVEALQNAPEYVAQYNDLKLHYDGRPIDDYRAAKDGFIADVLARVSR